MPAIKDRAILIDIKMIEMGIATGLSGADIKKQMSSLSEDEKIKLKRKFRKVWRKIARNDKNTSRVLGLGRDPDDHHKRSRRAWVRRHVALSVKS